MSRNLRRTGCVAVVGLLLLAGATVAVVFVTARSQIRDDAAAADVRAPELPAAAAGAPLRVELDVEVAQLIVVPAGPGESLGVEADYDPRRYELHESLNGDDASGWRYRLDFRPRGSPLWALFKVKIGAPISSLRLTLPGDTPIRLVGRGHGALANLELGGLHVETAELTLKRSGAAVSFADSLRAPMERLSLVCDKGAIKVSGLGHASPLEAHFEQHLGEIDLDLRGPWIRDGRVRIDAQVAGGSVWLPSTAEVVGIDRPFRPQGQDREIPLPTLTLEVSEETRAVVFVE